MALDLRPITLDEFEEWRLADGRAFGHHVPAEAPPWVRAALNPDRSLAVFDDGRIVGGAHSHASQIVVPGGAQPVACVDAVSVQPTHRRRGLLTRMMARQLADLHELGESLSALWASESAIYGRFGYGVGTIHERWSIDRRHAAFTRPYATPGRVAFVDGQQVKSAFPEVHRRATRGHLGSIEPPARVWDAIVADLEGGRMGASANFYVAYEEDGQVDGYVIYRVKGETLIVVELMSVTNDAHAALWQYCFGVDLRTSTEAYNRPVDDPLPWMLADPRGLQRVPHDALWLRLVDVRATLEDRQYSDNGALLLEVSDPVCPWNEGRYELEGGPDGAECRPSTADPDLVLSVADLAAAYLGAVSFTTLSHAGRVEERKPGALLRADAMFAADRAPWCPYNF